MPITLPPLWDDLTFMTPLSEQRAGRLVDFLADDLHGTVLDIGCGWAEVLLRVVAAAPGVHGVGIDLDVDSITHGRALAEQRGLAGRVSLINDDARTCVPEQVDAVLCIGASQVWGPPVEDNQPLDYASALAAIRAMVRPGARVVYGEGIWSCPPTSAAVAPLAGRLDEFVSLSPLIEIAVAHGFQPVAVHEASLDEWDQFESGYCARYSGWLSTHGPDHPDAAEIRTRAAQQRTAYFDGYRGVLGMAYLALLAV